LIHSAAGGTGLALTQLALHAGARVIGTASPWKWPYLQKLGVKDLYSSRTLDFVEGVKKLTGGRGVDIVVNSLTGDFIPGGMQVLCAGGKFIEIGKAEIWSPEQVSAVRRDISYVFADLVEVNKDRPELIREMLVEVLGKFASGDLRPLPVQRYPISHVQEAFRFMQQARHIGKIVLQHDAGDLKNWIRGDGVYLISGGTKGLGLLTGEWLVSEGARHLVLLSRSGIGAAERVRVERLESLGATVRIVSADVSDEASVSGVLEGINQPLLGVVHAAGLLSDGMISNQTPLKLSEVYGPKVKGAFVLDKLTRGRGLDFFIMYSSAASMLGSPGQLNYCGANAFLDSLAYYRRSCGETGTVINWGAWSGSGMASRLEESGRKPGVRGVELIDPETGLMYLSLLLRRNVVQSGVIGLRWDEMEISASDPFYERMQSAKVVPGSKAERSVKAELRLSDPSEREAKLRAYVLQQVLMVLGITESAGLGGEKGFFDLGMDSLTIMELRNILQRNLEIKIGTDVVFDYPSPDKLAGYIASKMPELFNSRQQTNNSIENKNPIENTNNN
jgi:NADP-dependent 3-hydroxy acid dehydrogenase YdfG/acyl carrier protein